MAEGLGAALFTMAGICLALVYVPRMYLDGTLSTSEAAGLGGGLLILSIAAFSLWGLVIGKCLAIVFIMGAGAGPFLRYRLEHRSVSDMSDREIAKWERTLAFDPTNVGAYVFLGRAYRELGDTAKAEEFYHKALELDPDDKQVRRDYSVLAQLRRQQAGERWVCPTCQADNAPEAKRCFRCSFRLPRVKGPAGPLARNGYLGAVAGVFIVGILMAAGVISATGAIVVALFVSLGCSLVYAYLGSPGD